MKWSSAAIWFTLTIYLVSRFLTLDLSKKHPLMVTDWDSLGYYVYLPGIFIYDDIKKYDWIEPLDKEYNITGGGKLYQVVDHPSGHKVGNYLCGIAIMQAPFFIVGHAAALMSDYPADGFSFPYQVAISLGLIMLFFWSIWMYRNILLLYFPDSIACITILLTLLATNIMEYVAIESGQCHGYLFVLYVAILYVTIKWHKNPSSGLSFFGGWIIGLATMCRPTEAIMLVIPLMWATNTKEARREKWQFLAGNKSFLIYALLGGLVGVLPQIMYWQYVTGGPFHAIGSKWYFLNPFWRVLIGWEKGWMIYTPITIFFVVGLWHIKKYDFKKSVIWFCALNTWIVISWSIWRYGGSYSTRALVQSYPIWGLALAAFIYYIKDARYRWLFYSVAIYLSLVNLFQIWQYNKGIIHYDHMNRQYYQNVYLDANPTPLDMSMLDTDFQRRSDMTCIDVTEKVAANAGNLRISIDEVYSAADIRLKVNTSQGYWGGSIQAETYSDDGILVVSKSFRLHHALTTHDADNDYHFHLRFDDGSATVRLGLADAEGVIRPIQIQFCK